MEKIVIGSSEQLPEQLDKKAKERLTKQQYRIVGSHSATS